jgi:hypothetical protein
LRQMFLLLGGFFPTFVRPGYARRPSPLSSLPSPARAGEGCPSTDGRGEGSFPRAWRPGLSRLAGPLPWLRNSYPKREDFDSLLLTQDTGAASTNRVEQRTATVPAASAGPVPRERRCVECPVPNSPAHYATPVRCRHVHASWKNGLRKPTNLEREFFF